LSSSSSSSSAAAWESPLLSLLSTTLKLMAASVATAVECQHGDRLSNRVWLQAGLFVTQSWVRACARAFAAAATVAAAAEGVLDRSTSSTAAVTSSIAGGMTVQQQAVSAVLAARTLVHIGSLVAAVAAGDMPYSEQLPLFLREECRATVACIGYQLNSTALHGDLAPAAAAAAAAVGPTGTAAAAAVNSSAAAGKGPTAAAFCPAEWCAAAERARDADYGPAVCQLMAQGAQLHEGLDRAASSRVNSRGEQKAVLQQLGQQLQEFGGAVCAALPVRFCCNNVQCMSLAGFSEQQQVAGRRNTCSGCKYARCAGPGCSHADFRFGCCTL
jgi:hypothetical protein